MSFLWSFQLPCSSLKEVGGVDGGGAGGAVSGAAGKGSLLPNGILL